MTIKEFHIAFDIELDKTLDFEYPYISPEQKDYWLNKAQNRFITSRLYPKDVRNPGFEQTQKRIDDLRDLVKPSLPLTPVNEGTIFKVTLPNDYLYLIRHWCKTSEPVCGVRSVGGIQVREDDMNNHLKNPFWRPTAEEPLFYFNGDKIIYETKGTFTVVESNLVYIKTPVQMKLGSEYIDPSEDVDCEITNHIAHQEILDIAISMVLENIESQRYQTNLNELTKSE